MKIHERLQKAEEILNFEAPWYVTHILGEVVLSDTGVAFGNYGDFATLSEMEAVIDWLVEEFNYKPKEKKTKAKKK